MKKLLLLVAVTLAFSLTSLAQAAGSSGMQTGSESTTTKTTTKKSTKKAAGDTGMASDSSKAAGKESTMTGCLAKDPSGSGYVLTNGRYKKGVSVKTSEDVSAHVGHKVKLTGTMEPADKSATMRTFDATKLDHVADTCGATKGAAAGGDMDKKGDMGDKKGKKGAKGTGTETKS